jgi:hypothetical protein
MTEFDPSPNAAGWSNPDAEQRPMLFTGPAQAESEIEEGPSPLPDGRPAERTDRGGARVDWALL